MTSSDDSPLEDRLWRELKEHHLPAERQWPATVEDRRYFIDMAVFCHSGSIALEADGDRWHATPQKSDLDNLRQNDLISVGWRVMHFTTRDIRERLREQMAKILAAINTLGGPDEAGLVGRRFVRGATGHAQQLAFMEEKAAYDDYPID